MGTAIFLIVAAVLLVSAAGARQAACRHIAAAIAEQNPRFGAMLRRLSVDLTAIKDEAKLCDAAIGSRRCLSCRHQSACETWLASGKREGYGQFCPNAELLEGLRSH